MITKIMEGGLSEYCTYNFYPVVTSQGACVYPYLVHNHPSPFNPNRCLIWSE